VSRFWLAEKSPQMTHFQIGGFTFRPLFNDEATFVESRDCWGQRRVLIEMNNALPVAYCEQDGCLLLGGQQFQHALIVGHCGRGVVGRRRRVPGFL
jgi:hypothetical protein